MTPSSEQVRRKTRKSLKADDEDADSDDDGGNDDDEPLDGDGDDEDDDDGVPLQRQRAKKAAPKKRAAGKAKADGNAVAVNKAAGGPKQLLSPIRATVLPDVFDVLQGDNHAQKKALLQGLIDYVRPISNHIPVARHIFNVGIVLACEAATGGGGNDPEQLSAAAAAAAFPDGA